MSSGDCFSDVTSWLLESSWSHLIHCSKPIFRLTCISNVASLTLWILPRSRNIKFQALAVEDLVVVESRRSLIKTDVLSRKHLVILCSAFGRPLSSRILKVILASFLCFDNTLGTFDQSIISKLARIISLCLFLWIQDSHHWLGLFQRIESLSGRHENGVGLGPLFFGCSKCSGAGLRFTFNAQIKLAFDTFIDFYKFASILSWTRSFLCRHP